MELKNLENRKKEILENLQKQYDELFEINCELLREKFKFPKDYRTRTFKILKGEKTLTYGKTSFTKIGLNDSGLRAYQLKRNGTYYTAPEIVELNDSDKLEWEEN